MIMKKILCSFVLMICLMSTLLVTGCGGDVVGEWKIQEYQAKYGDVTLVYTEEQVAGLTYYEEMPQNATLQQKVEFYFAQNYSAVGDGKMVFTENGELNIYIGEQVSYNTYKKDGSTIIMYTQTPEGVIETKYTYKDNKLMVSNTQDGLELKIIYQKTK